MTDETIELLLAGATAHGESDEPDHEVGDLQGMVRAACRLLTASQVEDFLDDAAVASQLESGEYDAARAALAADVDRRAKPRGRQRRITKASATIEPFGGSHAPDCPYRVGGECLCWRSDPDENPELETD